MKLRITGDIPASLIEQVRQDLAPLLPIVLDRTTVLQQSHLPPQVRLIGDRSEWMASLKEPAGKLLARLHAGGGPDYSNDRSRISEALSDASVEPLRKVARSLCSILAQHTQKSLHVGVGLAFPDWQHLTTLKLMSPDEELIAVALAQFVSQLPDVELAIKEEIRGPRKPYGHVQLEVGASGGILLRWLDEKELNYHQREVKPSATPIDSGQG
jgi:hypothetical protein